MIIKTTMEIPTTARDWELYRLEGDELAARELTEALEAAVGKVIEGVARADAYEDIWEPVARKYAKFGANDTEPRGHANEALRRARRVYEALKGH